MFEASAESVDGINKIVVWASSLVDTIGATAGA